MRRLFVPLLAALSVVACGGPSMTAQDAIDAFTEAGLPAPDPQDVTEATCPDIGCEEAVATDVVTVFRWSDSSQALVHANDLRQPAYSLDELVIVFPVDTEVDTSDYANALQDAAAERPDG